MECQVLPIPSTLNMHFVLKSDNLISCYMHVCTSISGVTDIPMQYSTHLAELIKVRV